MLLKFLKDLPELSVFHQTNTATANIFVFHPENYILGKILAIFVLNMPQLKLYGKTIALKRKLYRSIPQMGQHLSEKVF